MSKDGQRVTKGTFLTESEGDVENGGQISLHRNHVRYHAVSVQGFQAVEGHGAHEEIVYKDGNNRAEALKEARELH